MGPFVNYLLATESSYISSFFTFWNSYSEIIGYIDGIESSHIVGNKQQYEILKFYLNNGNERRVQVITWNDDIDNIINHIRPNYVNISF